MFDDALLLEAVWPRVEAELPDDVGLRALRRIEAGLAGVWPSRLRFSRSEWERERMALRGLREHVRRGGLASYVPNGESAPRFVVH
jgi:hypothetical protein